MKISELRESYDFEEMPSIGRDFEVPFLSLKSYWKVLSSLIELIEDRNHFNYTECLGSFYACESLFLKSFEQKGNLELLKVAIIELGADISYLLAKQANTLELGKKLHIQAN